jgi:glutamate 5-kinase
VEKMTPELDAMADATEGARSGGMGSGGMISKLQAARIAASGGCHMAIVNGTVDAPLQRFEMQQIGTVFPAPLDGPTARKRWLAGRMTASGKITVDDGAARALASGKSLLAAGVVQVDGNFTRGDVVNILASDGSIVARGLIGYDADDAVRIIGRKSSDIEKLLGYMPRSAMIHRDDLVML